MSNGNFVSLDTLISAYLMWVTPNTVELQGGEWYYQITIAMPFVPSASKTIQKITVFTDSVTGTLGANDLQCDIYSDNGGLPGSSLSNTTTVTTVPTSVNTPMWCEFIGLSQAVTVGNQYWIYITNVASDNVDNYPTYELPSFNYYPVYLGWDAYGFNGTTNIGSFGALLPYRIQYDDGSFEGMPLESVNYDATNLIYQNKEYGVKFTSPPIELNVAGVDFLTEPTGSPTGTLVAKIYNADSNTLLATGVAAPYNTDAFYFSDSVTLPASTTIRITLGESDPSADDASDAYQMLLNNWQNDANSLILKPFNGTLEATYYDGSSWTDGTTTFPGIQILLSGINPFSEAPGNSGSASPFVG